MTNSEFLLWFSSEIGKMIIQTKSPAVSKYINPDKYWVAAEKLLRRINEKIDIPRPYPWRGLNKYGMEIWSRNSSILYSLPFSQGKIPTSNNHLSTTSPSPKDKNKERVATEYKAIKSLFYTIINEFRGLILSNSELRTINTQLISKLSGYYNRISEEEQFALNNMSWDKLVIGFFGETNAGKSTIIESLRILLNEQSRKELRQKKGNCDGEIVGDGRQDFTQDYHEYEMNIKGQNFVLIDVPGIEGKENLFNGKIGEALRKAHLIFYVNGRNKNIDGGTASKIKKFLGDGVKVAVLQNIRGNTDQYEFPEDRKTLMTKSTSTIMEYIKRDFRNLIGDKFHTAIPVMGLLSMCSYGEFSPKREDLTKKQRILIKYFGEDCNSNHILAKDRIRHFSNIDEVINLIYLRSNNFKTEIANANFAKMEMFCRRVLKEYIEEVENKKIKFDSYRKQVNLFINDNFEEINTTKQQFEHQIQSDIRSFFTHLIEESNAHIVACNWTSLENCFKNKKSEIETLIKSRLNESNTDLTRRINERATRLKAIPGFSSLESSIGITININELNGSYAIRKEDDISFKDFMTSASSTIGGATTGAVVGGLVGSLIPFVGTAIGAWIGGGLGALTGNVSGNIKAGDNQTERAKKKAREIIQNYRKKTENQIKSVIQKYSQTITDEIERINQIARSRIHEVDKFYYVSQSSERRLKEKLINLQNHGK